MIADPIQVQSGVQPQLATVTLTNSMASSSYPLRFYYTNKDLTISSPSVSPSSSVTIQAVIGTLIGADYHYGSISASGNVARIAYEVSDDGDGVGLFRVNGDGTIIR